MHNELVKLVESANIDLQEKELRLIKEEGQRLLTEMKESAKKLEEAGFGRGVIGRQMSVIPTADEAKLYRLGKMLKDASPEEAEEIKREIQMLNDRIDAAGRGTGSSILGPHSADHIELGIGRPQGRSASSFRRQGERIAQKNFKAPPIKGIMNQIKDLELKLGMARSKEEGDKILSQIKYLKSQMEQ